MLPDSLFVSALVHQRDVTLPDGSTHPMHFRELPAVEFIKFSNAHRSGSEDAKAGAACRLVAASLCEASGKPAMDLDRALTLKPDALNALFSAVMEVNGRTPDGSAKEDAGNALPSAENNGSGTS